MGAFYITGGDLIEGVAEIIGFKLGLLVTDEQLTEAITGAGLGDQWPTDRDQVRRYRSEEYEGICRAALAAFGDPDARGNQPPVAAVMSAVDPAKRAFAGGVIDSVISLMQESHPIANNGTMSADSILTQIFAQYGEEGRDVAAKLLGAMNAALFTSPWANIRRTDWTDFANLEHLFTKEEKFAPFNQFFDQRFIDYLAARLDSVASINWRQFEFMIAEYLDRAGLSVDVGPGRNDGGVDIRAWPKTVVKDEVPALVIVQCKRQGSDIQKTAVKALYTDVLWEGAQAGLLVTSGRWAPGSRETVAARAYPVGEIERTALRRWITDMRTPGSGISLLD